MTEAEWQACVSPDPMLAASEDRASDRKLCLFAIACARRSWRSLDEAARLEIAVWERCAEGLATVTDVQTAARIFCIADFGEPHINPNYVRLFANQVAWDIAFDIAAERHPDTDPDPYAPANSAGRDAEEYGFKVEQALQCELLRDIFGNPFRPARLWLEWRTVTSIAIASAIYTDRAFDRLPILADALEDAGCTDAAILDHCRQPGEHVRGCWAVDLVLARS